MEELKRQLTVALKDNDENKIKDLLNNKKENKISLINYFAYIQDIDMLKKVVKYADFYENINKLCDGLDRILKASGVDSSEINKDNYVEILNEALNNFQKTITQDEVKLFDAIIENDVDKVETMINNNQNLINTKYFDRTLLMMIPVYSSFEIFKKLFDFNIISINAKDNNNGTALMFASQLGRVDIVKELLNKKNIQVNVQATNGVTALMLATEHNNIDIVNALLEKGAKVNLKMKDDSTVLILAAENGYTNVVNILLKNGAKVNIQDCEGLTALMRALQNNHIDIANILLKKGAKINIQDNNGWTALMYAIKDGCVGLINDLLEKGAGINVRNNENSSPLMLALDFKRHDIFDILLGRGARINVKSNNGWTPLIWASARGCTSAVSALLTMGAKQYINFKNEKGSTALILAAQNGYVDIVNILLRNGADINIQNDRGLTALIVASKNGHTNVVSTLLENGAKVNLRSKYRFTALMCAALNNDNADIVNILINNGADINMRDHVRRNSLMLAAQNGNVEIINTLLKNGANNSINFRDKYGFTALLTASKFGNVNAINTLIKAGANINMRASLKRTLLMIAAEKGYIDVINTLLNNDSIKRNIDTKDIYGCTALMYAAESGYIDAINILINNGANINEKSYAGDTTLSTALICNKFTKNSGIDFIDTLIKLKADVNSCDISGRTPLFFASEYSNLDIVKKLVEAGADVNVVDNTGYNVLTQASKRCKRDIIDFLISKGALANINTKAFCNVFLIESVNIYIDHQNVIKFLKSIGLTLDKAIEGADFNNRYFKENILRGLLLNDISITAKEMIEADKATLAKLIRVAASESTPSPFHGKDSPLRDFIEAGKGFSSINDDELAEIEREGLDNIATRFDNAIINKNQKEINNSISDLFELCKTNENIYRIMEAVIDKNVVYQDSHKSLSALLNNYGFDTGEFAKSIKGFEMNFSENNEAIEENVFPNRNFEINGENEDSLKVEFDEYFFKRQWHIVDKIIIDKNNTVNKSIVNKFIEIMANYMQEDEEGEFRILSRNLDINNACLVYQQDKTEENKENLINAIINNTNSDQKKILFDWLDNNTCIFEIKRGESKYSFMYLFNFVTSDFGTYLKNELQNEIDDIIELDKENEEDDANKPEEENELEDENELGEEDEILEEIEENTEEEIEEEKETEEENEIEEEQTDEDDLLRILELMVNNFNQNQRE